MWCSFSRGWTVKRIWTGWSVRWRRSLSCLAAARPKPAPPGRGGGGGPGGGGVAGRGGGGGGGPERVLSPREALFARTERLSLEDCAGRVSAVQLAPYPPGVPVVAPGERITEKELAYLREIGYNNHEVSVIL